jgi:hypothetical protein
MHKISMDPYAHKTAHLIAIHVCVMALGVPRISSLVLIFRCLLTSQANVNEKQVCIFASFIDSLN